MRTASLLLFAVVALCAPAAAQTGQVMPAPKFLAYDGDGDPCSGCKLYSYAAGTTTPQDTYTTSALSVANANPVVLDSAGRATVFIDPTLSYKFTLKTAADVDIYTVDNVVGPFSGVLSVTAADTRGVQISRSGADAGLSIASSGGSGKTYGIVSTTTGQLLIRDDSDGTPNIEFLGNNITAALTGTFTVSGGLLSVTGVGSHSISGSGTGAQSFIVQNTNTGTGAYAQVTLGNSGSNSATRFVQTSTGFTTSAPYLQDGTILEAGRAGGLSLYASNAAGDIRLYAGGSSTARVTVADTGATTITNLTATLQNSGTAQPGFLAYNSANDAVASSATVDFDTEVYDTSSAFAADTFTAAVTGIYHLCAHVIYTTTVEASRVVSIVTSNRSYILQQLGASDNLITFNASGCVYADMDAADTATVSAVSLSGGTISGGASPYATWFSGRLVP